jgi:hypothetical protein
MQGVKVPITLSWRRHLQVTKVLRPVATIYESSDGWLIEFCLTRKNGGTGNQVGYGTKGRKRIECIGRDVCKKHWIRFLFCYVYLSSRTSTSLLATHTSCEQKLCWNHLQVLRFVLYEAHCRSALLMCSLHRLYNVNIPMEAVSSYLKTPKRMGMKLVMSSLSGRLHWRMCGESNYIPFRRNLTTSVV